MDCIYETLSIQIPNLTIKEIFGCNGIANSIVSFKYAGEWFDIIDGRGMGNPIEIVQSLNIPFSIYSLDDFWECKSKENILIFASKDLFSQYKNINLSYKQLLFFYSCFYVDKQKDNEVTLKVVRDDTEYVMRKEDLEKIYSVSTFPLERPIYIIKIEDTSYMLDDVQIKKSLLDKVNIFLGNSVETDELRIKITGSNMYDEFAKRIKNRCDKWDKMSIMRQNFLIASLNAGSVGLYRREFADSLSEVLGMDNNEVCDNFRKSANAWREIGRELAYFQNSNVQISEECKNYILPIIEEIKNLEMESMKIVRNYLIGDLKR